MKLAHLLSGQLVIVATLTIIFTLSDGPTMRNFLNKIIQWDLFHVTDEKGAILLLISANLVILFVIDWLRSQAIISNCKLLSKSLRRTKNTLAQNTNLFFMIFLIAYIFRSMNQRIYNLLGCIFVFIQIQTAGLLCRTSTVAITGQFGFFMCTVVILLHVLIRPIEKYYTLLLRVLRFL